MFESMSENTVAGSGVPLLSTDLSFFYHFLQTKEFTGPTHSWSLSEFKRRRAQIDALPLGSALTGEVHAESELTGVPEDEVNLSDSSNQKLNQEEP